MKFSYSWLTEHLKTNVHFEEIEKKLTSIGLEVEDIQDSIKKRIKADKSLVKKWLATNK